MRWTEDRITQEIAWLRTRRGDSTYLEVKSAQGGYPESLAETICAFANMPEGGTILLGIAEKREFAILGVENPAQLEAAAADQARKSIEPPPGLDTYTVMVAGVPIVVIDVIGLDVMTKPARYRQRAYLRQADGDYEMRDHELRMLEVAKLQVGLDKAFDRQGIPDTALVDLRKDLVDRFLQTQREKTVALRDIDDDAQALKMLGCLTSDGTTTVAGLYGLGAFPQGLFPSLSVTLAERLEESTEGRIRGLETIDGPIPDLLSGAMNWIRRHLTSTQTYDDAGNMRNVYDLPLPAVREVVANALVHRDLGPYTLESGRAIDIRLYKDRLVVISPGGLKGLTREQLRSEELTRVEVNQHLYRIARSQVDQDGNRIIEGEGGGLQEVLGAFRRIGRRSPDFIDTGVKFTAILWRSEPGSSETSTDSLAPAPVLSELEDRVLLPDTRVEQTVSQLVAKKLLNQNAQMIYQVLRDSDSKWTVPELVGKTQFTDHQVRYALKKLKDCGLVRMEGGRGKRGTVYLAAKR